MTQGPARPHSAFAGVTHHCSAVAMSTVDVFHKFGLPSVVWDAVLPEITDGNDDKENVRVIADINRRLGITVRLVAQNLRQTLAIAQHGYVLSQGRLVAQGTAQALADDARVRAAYFG